MGDGRGGPARAQRGCPQTGLRREPSERGQAATPSAERGAEQTICRERGQTRASTDPPPPAASRLARRSGQTQGPLHRGPRGANGLGVPARLAQGLHLAAGSEGAQVPLGTPGWDGPAGREPEEPTGKGRKSPGPWALEQGRHLGLPLLSSSSFPLALTLDLALAPGCSLTVCHLPGLECGHRAWRTDAWSLWDPLTPQDPPFQQPWPGPEAGPQPSTPRP